jgi:hypothetical protein
MTTTLRTVAILSAAALIGREARADDGAESAFRLDPASVYAQPASGEQPAASVGDQGKGAESGSTPAPVSPREKRFGRAGSRWWSIGAGVANDFSGDTDMNVHGDFSQFLADELEFGIEAAGWYFNQEGQDTGGLSGSMIFRWHAFHWGGQDGFKSTVFGDVGIGMLVGFDEVPDGGTGLNFLPRVGIGYTHALTDDEEGARLTLGLRWHHISNARIEGDARNPARDALMIYAEIQFPF